MRRNSATKADNILIGFFSLILVIVLALMGCGGGGSAGTGTDPVVVVQGEVIDQSGDPVKDVSVRVLESGSEDVTSSDGEFELTAPPASGEVTLEIVSENGVSHVTVTTPQEGGTVSVTLTVNP